MSVIDKDEIIKLVLDSAQNYADENSTCAKVKVGSIIIPEVVEDDKPFELFGYMVRGCNHGVHNCKENGCRRIQLYGNASKEHRLPSDCDALHSEIDAISRAAKSGRQTRGATIFVTRYPCEACARAIIAAGIKKVYYGRKESISDYTAKILAAGDVKVIKVDTWEREDNNE